MVEVLRGLCWRLGFWLAERALPAPGRVLLAGSVTLDGTDRCVMLYAGSVRNAHVAAEGIARLAREDIAEAGDGHGEGEPQGQAEGD